MIARFGLLTRDPNVSPEAFDRHWRDVHGPLAAQFPGLRSYEQNRVVNNEQFGISNPRGAWDLAGLSELHFDDLASMKAAVAAQHYGGVQGDQDKFVKDVHIVACEKHVVVPLALPDGPFIKRMTLLKRPDGMTPEEFRHEWLVVHAAMVRQWPNVLGYNQNIVVERYHGAPADNASYDKVPVDGIVEFWFRNTQEAADVYASDIARETQVHAKSFLQEITPFFVETRKIV